MASMMRSRAIFLALLLGVGCSNSKARPPATDGAQAGERSAKLAKLPRAPLPPEASRKDAPGFDGATAWINSEKALSKKDLAGKVVVVDFWTSCCINCIHTLPILTELEKRFEGEPVVVVGVHSPKFDAETEQERLRAAVQQYGIEHPIAIDGSMKIWKGWEAKAWPTVLVLDAKGRIVWTGSGEPKLDELSAHVASALDEGADQRALVRGPIPGLHPEAKDTGPLAFPGKVAPIASGGFVLTDTGHHRVVFAKPDGSVDFVVGTGLAGKTDGGYAEASFKKPQGLVEVGEIVYVADTENHLVRAIDRRSKTVTTVAGTGEIGRGHLEGEVDAKTFALRSPWDLAWADGRLFIALAGSHQIGVLDPGKNKLQLFAGDGKERRKDGVGPEASFAQPSGLATDGKTLFVADSETSSVRGIDLKSRAVRTLVGEDLFVFGDVDGPPRTVRLQHPIGIAYGAGALFVADTYNSKVKRIDPATGETKTVAGGPGRKVIFEPQGLYVKGQELVVADTNHHRIVRVPHLSPLTPPTFDVVSLGGLRAPSRGVALAKAIDPGAGPGETVSISDVALAQGAPTKVHVAWKAPPGTAVNEGAPFRVRWSTSEGLSEAPADVKAKGGDVQDGFDVVVEPTKGATMALLGGQVDIVVCDSETHAICVPVKRKVEMTFHVDKNAKREVSVEVPLPAAKAK